MTKKKMLKFLLKTRNPSTANANEAVDVEDAVVETVRPATISAEKRDDINNKSKQAKNATESLTHPGKRHFHGSR